jgi:hypothetical protein
MEENSYPTTPKRVQAFASFFKRYMSVSTVVVAAMPIPISNWKLIPIYEGHRSLLMTYTPLFCFLILGFIFYSRHTIARNSFYSNNRLFRLFIKNLPLLLIAASLGCLFAYHSVLASTVSQDGNDPLLIKDLRLIPSSNSLIALYLGVFLAAEAAFILMAINEYMQDVLQLDEKDLVLRRAGKKETTIAGKVPVT